MKIFALLVKTLIKEKLEDVNWTDTYQSCLAIVSAS